MKNNLVKSLIVIIALLINACIFVVLDVTAAEDGTDKNYPRISNAQILEMEFSRISRNSTDNQLEVLPSDPLRGVTENSFSPSIVEVGRLDMTSSEFSEKLDLRKNSGLPLWLLLDGKEYAIQPLDRYDDISQGVRHETLALVGDELGIARFTITGSGDVVLVGTITVGNDHYRIIADGGPSEDLLVFSMSEGSNNSGNMPIEYAKVVSNSEEQKYLAYLEDLHVESLLLAEREPQFTNRARGFISANTQLIGGNLGTVAVNDINLAAAPALLKRVLMDLGPTTGVDTSTQFEILDVSGMPSIGYIITFRQLLNGIPVERVNTVEVAPVSGEIKSIDTVTFISQPIDPMTNGAINQANAENYAIVAVRNHLERHDDNFAVQEGGSNLVYAVQDLDSLVLQWIIIVEDFMVRVDAYSGETTVQDMKMRAGATQLLTETCRHTSISTAQNPKCEDANVGIVYRETPPPGCGGEGVQQCIGGTSCNARHLNVYNTIGHAEAEWAVGNPASCCKTAGQNDNRIGVLLDSQSAARGGEAYYLPRATGQIHLPPAGIYPYPGDPALDSSLVAHEATHAIEEALNKNLTNAPATDFAVALIEGIANAFAYVVDRRHGYNSNPAVLFPLTSPLTISDSRGFYDIWYYPPPEYAEYAVRQNSLVIANFFYRVSKVSGVTLDNMSKLVIETLIKITSSGGSSSSDYDLGDFESAVLAASTGNSILRSAVVNVFSTMENRPPEFPWGHYPPEDLRMSFASCSNGIWTGTFQWNSTGADAYQVILQGPIVTDPKLVLITGTSVPISTAIPVTLRVSSCDWGYGPFSTTRKMWLCGSSSVNYLKSPGYCL